MFSFDLLKNIREQVEEITPILPDQAIVTVGQYMLESVDSPSFQGDDMCQFIHIVHMKDMEHKSMWLDPEFSVMLDTEYMPHYWFDLIDFFENNDFNDVLSDTIFPYHKEVLTLSNMSEGSTSGILPKLHSFLAEEDKSSIAVSVIPSMIHSSDAIFNAFSSIGVISTEKSTPLILLDQAKLEDYDGVHRDGEILQGSEAVEYAISILMEKRGFIRDLAKLSRSFDVSRFSMLLATGCSLDIYENLRNILDVSLEQPLMDIDYSTAKMFYVVVRAPRHYQDDYSKGQIEFEVSRWLNESLGVDIPQICEPVFTDEYGDRLDLVILVGGFDMSRMFRNIYRRIERFSDMNLEQDLYDSELWSEIKENLLES
jgi:hypothetical protein